VLDVEGGPTLLSKYVQQPPGVLCGRQWGFQFHFSARKIVVLDVDQDQGCFHGSIVTRNLTRCFKE
jgi:hypothetical protein